MLQVRLLGQFDVRADGKRVSLNTRAGQSLFAFLVLNAGAEQRREKLAGLLWPETTDENSRKYLRQELWRVRKALAVESAEGANALRADGLTVSFVPGENFWLDVAQFETALPADTPLNERINRVALYEGELLPGFYEDWVLLERERVQAMFETQIRELLELLLAGKHWQSIVGWAEKWIALGQTPEAAYRALMLTYAMLGDRPQCMATYERCRAALDKGLGVEPSAETQQLYQELMSGDTIAGVSLNSPRILVGMKSALRDQAPAPGEPPFKGLEFFDQGDAALFYGRETLTAKLAAALNESAFLAVVIGASGSGKSSIVRAGLIPALSAEKTKAETKGVEGNGWRMFVITPTAHPLEALAVALTLGHASVTETAILIDDLAQDPRCLHLWLQRLASGSSGHTVRSLFVLDQFEELFTLCRDELEREQFIDNLVFAVSRSSAAGKRSSDVSFVLTLRADFYAHLAQFPELRELVAQHQEYIGPMTSDELRRAIEEPAKQGAADGAAWEFEPGLVDLILRDVGDEPGALPLLSHALLETWRRRSGYTMTLKGYHDAGGVRGAITQTAEATYHALTPQEQEIARNIFLRLTELGEGTEDTRRRGSFQELVPDGHDATQVQTVLAHLVEARLVTMSEHGVEVAHEALIREWARLRDWLNQDREGLRLQRQLTEAAHEWELLERDAGALYRGARLAQAREWAVLNLLALNAQERAFLEASEENEKREAREQKEQQQRELEAAQKLAETEQRANKQLRRRALLLAAAFVLAILLAAAALFFGNRANENAVVAQENAQAAGIARDESQVQERIAESRGLAAYALNNLSLDPQLSILLALQAIKATEPDKTVLPEAEDALHRAVIASHVQAQLPYYSSADKVPPSDFFRTFRASFNADGSRVAMRGPGIFKILDVRTHQELLNLPVSPDFGAVGLGYSADGTQLATIDHDASASETLVKIFDANSGKLVRETRIAQPWRDVLGVGFSPNLKRVVLMPVADSPMRVWDIKTGQSLATLAVTNGYNLFPSAAFSPDGRRLIVAIDDTAAKILDPATGKELMTLCCHGSTVTEGAFSPDGKRVATVGWDSKVKLWDAETGKELNSLAGHTNVLTDVVWSPDGKRLASTSWDRRAIVWDAETGKLITELSGHKDFIEDADFSPDGASLVTASFDNTAILWGVGPSRELAAKEGPPLLYPAGYNSDRTHFYTYDGEGTLKVWDTETLQVLKAINLGYQFTGLDAVTISPDEKFAAFIGNDSAIHMWDFSGKQVRTISGEKDGFGWGPKFSPDGSRIVAMSNGQTMQLTVWNLKSGEPPVTIPLGPLVGTFVENVSWSPDGKRLVTGMADGAVRVWDASSGAHLLDLPGHTNFIWQILYSPDGSKIATASRDGIAIVHDAETGKEMARLIGHTSTVDSLDWSPDGKRIMTASSDGTAKLWDVLNGTELATFNQGAYPVEAAIFAGDGKHVITTSDDGALREYTLDVNELVELAKARLIRTWRVDECQKFLHLEQCP